MSEALLATEDLTKQFEGVTAVDGVSATFEKDSLHAVIGPNGAGKTTFFNLLTGALRPSSGRIHFAGEDITDLSPAEIARRRLTRSYQVTNVFDELSVLENVRIAIQARHSMYNFWSKASSMPNLVTEAEEILERVGLLDKRDVNAATLSHGERRTLELAIALGTTPKMLLLDEPTSGMSAEETKEMISLIEELSSDVTIILVEHKMSVVMQVSDRIKVLHRGQIISDGTPEEVQNDEEVRRVYLEGGQEQ
ncbi:ABC transporter ATP-binding protein [Haladaptatus halobius]|uniref:ABC transporter ATP-binding protein n=1 Tax=Haladaptatus halobius TaxID=2884875 RepID=UPI001D0B396C|nr:ABC transporter ATP-binding protein [Haladaptatus halobius]